MERGRCPMREFRGLDSEGESSSKLPLWTTGLNPFREL